MTRVALGLGSNLGDRRRHLEKAVSELGERVGNLVSVSSLYETEPMGGPAQGAFLNAVIVVETGLGPRRILEETQLIEDHHGRLRTVRWGPRTLDIDILAHDKAALETPDLVIPHPRAHERLFVVEPLREVWPDATLADGLPAKDERGLDDQEVVLVDRAWWQVPPT